MSANTVYSSNNTRAYTWFDVKQIDANLLYTNGIKEYELEWIRSFKNVEAQFGILVVLNQLSSEEAYNLSIRIYDILKRKVYPQISNVIFKEKDRYKALFKPIPNTDGLAYDPKSDTYLWFDLTFAEAQDLNDNIDVSVWWGEEECVAEAVKGVAVIRYMPKDEVISKIGNLKYGYLLYDPEDWDNMEGEYFHKLRETRQKREKRQRERDIFESLEQQQSFKRRRNIIESDSEEEDDRINSEGNSIQKQQNEDKVDIASVYSSDDNDDVEEIRGIVIPDDYGEEESRSITKMKEIETNIKDIIYHYVDKVSDDLLNEIMHYAYSDERRVVHIPTGRERMVAHTNDNALSRYIHPFKQLIAKNLPKFESFNTLDIESSQLAHVDIYPSMQIMEEWMAITAKRHNIKFRYQKPDAITAITRHMDKSSSSKLKLVLVLSKSNGTDQKNYWILFLVHVINENLALLFTDKDAKE